MKNKDLKKIEKLVSTIRFFRDDHLSQVRWYRLLDAKHYKRLIMEHIYKSQAYDEVLNLFKKYFDLED